MEPNPIFVEGATDMDVDSQPAAQKAPESSQLITGKAQFNKDLGTDAFQHVRPEFRKKVEQGFVIIVAGSGFGSGSSREEAPRAIKGARVKAVIAKSYAFIYSRNQPNMTLMGIIFKDERFYELAKEGFTVSIDLPNRTIICEGETFPFNLSVMKERLIFGGGVTEMCRKYRDTIFRAAISVNPDKFLKSYIRESSETKAQLA
ncbi:hypothetical protein BB560_005074 [Smittium megazygosporum]|uniref:Aconitase A/isopropylmalate dehydratase small subunit swivel domain-containing protein n=1 Tax=Smittium megazygosporum TaxID=133381 RepID=A0A2T9Z7G3_9FUNG|nr:hypothetical protein BB560_005074 [Smittium megazygosporum]